jgi:uncharacterized membrane protein
VGVAGAVRGADRVGMTMLALFAFAVAAMVWATRMAERDHERPAQVLAVTGCVLCALAACASLVGAATAIAG